MLSYIIFTIFDYNDVSLSDVLDSYLELSFTDFYQWLLDKNIAFKYDLFIRPFDVSVYRNRDDYIFSVRIDNYGV